MTTQVSAPVVASTAPASTGKPSKLAVAPPAAIDKAKVKAAFQAHQKAASHRDAALANAAKAEDTMKEASRTLFELGVTRLTDAHVTYSVIKRAGKNGGPEQFYLRSPNDAEAFDVNG